MSSPAKTVAIIQARLGSTRLPGKVLMDLGGRPIIAHVVERARAIPGVDEVVVAIPQGAENLPLRAVVEGLGGATVFAGSEADVLDRYYQAAKASRAGVVVRVTADCPFLDPELSGRVVALLASAGTDFASNNTPPGFPHGCDVEAFRFAALEAAWKEARLPLEREHVTPFLRAHPERFKQANLPCPRQLYHIRLTVDEPADLELARALQARLGPSASTGWEEIVSILEREPGLARINARVRSGHYWDPADSRWRFAKESEGGRA